MHSGLSIYIVLQSLLFSILLISRGKPGNKDLAFYFIYLILFHTFFLLSDEESIVNFADNGYVRLGYQTIALCNSAVVFFFLYSILERAVPKPLYLLWLLPVFNEIWVYCVETFRPDMAGTAFYKSWHLNFPFYIKILFVFLLLWQLSVLKKERTENGQTKNQYQLTKLRLAKHFVYFQILVSSSLVLYMLFTLANGRLFVIHSSYSIYSPDYYNVISRGGTMLFLFAFALLALQNPFILSNFLRFQLQTSSDTINDAQTRNENSTRLKIPGEQIARDQFTLDKQTIENNGYLDPALLEEDLKFKISEEQRSEFQLALDKLIRGDKVLTVKNIKKNQSKSEITAEQATRYQMILHKLIMEDKIYLDPKLSLSKMAGLAAIPSRQLSAFILASSKKKFKEYINGFRVLHAQKLLSEKDASRYTMYLIAFDSGFNSESSFYKIFKDETGLTPKQYREHITSLR